MPVIDCEKPQLERWKGIGMGFSPYSTGDWVVYRKTKFSRHPGSRARNIAPAPNGDGYSYNVDKFWIVDVILPDGRLRLRTRRGKTHVVSSSDPNLRVASFWQRVRHRRRFEEVLRDQAAPAPFVSSGPSD